MSDIKLATMRVTIPGGDYEVYEDGHVIQTGNLHDAFTQVMHATGQPMVDAMDAIYRATQAPPTNAEKIAALGIGRAIKLRDRE